MAAMRPSVVTCMALLGLCLMSGASARLIKTGRGLSQTPGAVTVVNPHLPEVQQAAKFVVAQINADPSLLPGLEGTALLVAVTNATEQIVSGVKYGLWITISNSANMATYWYTKAVVLDTPWNTPNMTLESLDVLTIIVGDSTSPQTLGEAESGSDNSSCPGCVQPVNPNSDDIKEVADFVVEQVNSNPSLLLTSTGSVSLVAITQATEQIVAGTRYGVWLTLKDEAAVQYRVQAYVLSPVDQTAGLSLQWFALITLPSTSPSSAINPFTAGGVSPANTSSPEVISAADFAAQQVLHNPALIPSAVAPVTVATIISATQQVVTGVQYGLDMLVKDTAGRTFHVQTTVLSVAWLLPPMSLVSYEVITYPPVLTTPGPSVGSTEVNTPISAPGAWTKADPSSPEVQSAAAFVVDQINLYPATLMPSAKAPVQEVSIVAAYSKVVTGVEYALSMIVKDSTNAYFSVEAIVLDIPWLLPGMTLQQFEYKRLLL